MMSNPFLSLAFDRIQMERWEWVQSVSLAKTHQMICNMTYLAQHMTSIRDLDLRSNSGIAFRREEHDAAKIMPPAFVVQKLFAIFFAKKRYFDLS